MNTLFFIHFLTSTLVLSLLLLLILFMKRFLKKYVSLKFQHYSRYLILFMLSIAFLPIGTFSLENDRIPVFSRGGNVPAAAFSVHSVADIMNQSTGRLQDFTVSVTRAIPEQLNFFLMIVWVIGFALTIGLTFYSNRRIPVIKKTIQPVDDVKTDQIFKKCKKRLRIRKKIILGKSKLLSTPATFGLMKPCVVLPDESRTTITATDIPYIFFHELTHYKHGDIYINFLICIFQALYWFNPLVWYTFKEIKTDNEIACDISVLEMLNEKHHLEYGKAIINCADRFLKLPHLNAASMMIGSKSQVKKRIQQIADFHKESKELKIKGTASILLIGLFILLNVPFLSAAALDQDIYHPSGRVSVAYEDMSRYFNGYQGSFVLYSTKTDQYTVYNKEKSLTRVSPDSTYKIYDSLIALETNAITREQTTIPWDGIKYSYPAWNRDQDLTSALKSSVNWYFQSLDKKIGYKDLQDYFLNIKYGNCDISGGISDYWLESSLKISPMEQVQLLRSFYSNQFGFKDENIDAVKAALLISRENNISLSGKTGTGTVNLKNRNGWFVGYVETAGNTYFFATNIQGGANPSGSEAAKITLSVLTENNIISDNMKEQALFQK